MANPKNGTLLSDFLTIEIKSSGAGNFSISVVFPSNQSFRYEETAGPMTNKNGHFIFVDQWMDDSLKTLSRNTLLDTFQQAIDAVWRRAQQTLGAITLVAVGDRIVHLAQESFPWLSPVRAEASGIMLHDLLKFSENQDDSKLREGLRYLLGEFLSVLHDLTAGVITPHLRAAIVKNSKGETTSAHSALDKRKRT